MENVNFQLSFTIVMRSSISDHSTEWPTQMFGAGEKFGGITDQWIEHSPKCGVDGNGG